MKELVVDWQSCRARGLCHELLPEVVELDEWGYPIVSSLIPRELLADARDAVRSCPELALKLSQAKRKFPRTNPAAVSATPGSLRTNHS